MMMIMSKNSNNDTFTIKSSILNERQKVVIETIRMRLNENQSLEYLKEVGFTIGPATYYREKKKIEAMKLKRLYYIAKIGFQDQYLDRIDNTELCLKLMWENYHLEKDPYKRFQMLKDVIMVQPYLSSYYETSKLVIDTKSDLLVDNIKNLQSEKNDEQDSSISFVTGEEDSSNKSRYLNDSKTESDNNRKF